MLSFVKNHSLEVGPVSDLVGRWVTCVGLGNAFTQSLGYVVIWAQVDEVQGYDEDQMALVILDWFVKLYNRIPAILGTPTISCIMNVIKEKEIDALVTPWVNAWVAHLLAVQLAQPQWEMTKLLGSQTLVNMMK